MVKKLTELLPYFCLGLILGTLLFAINTCNSNTPSIRYINKTKTIIDTQLVELPKPEPVIIEKKIFIQRIDTVFLDKKEIIVNPFVVSLDTITKDKDTVHFSYFYPEEKLYFTIYKPVPKIQVITITKDNYVEPSDWNKALYFVGGALTMYIGNKLGN